MDIRDQTIIIKRTCILPAVALASATALFAGSEMRLNLVWTRVADVNGEAGSKRTTRATQTRLKRLVELSQLVAIGSSAKNPRKGYHLKPRL